MVLERDMCFSISTVPRHCLSFPKAGLLPSDIPVAENALEFLCYLSCEDVTTLVDKA